jgi:hypothetical protein
VLAVAGILIDAARIVSGEAHVKRAVSSAARSLLADYCSDLKNQYGIFAINQDSGKNLDSLAKEYVEKNLSIGLKDLENVNLYNFKIESISITPIFNLTENQTVKNQILEYMKYRAPKQLIQNFWEKVSAVKECTGMIQTYKKKLDVDKLLGQIGELQQKLKANISGTIGNEKVQNYYINEFDIDGSRTATIERYGGIIMRQGFLYQELSNISEEIIQIKIQIGSINDQENILRLKDELEMLEERSRGIISELEELAGDRNTIEKRLKEDLTGEYIRSNQQAEEIIAKIAEVGKTAEYEILELEKEAKGNLENHGIQYRDFKNVIQEDIAELKDILLEGQRAEELKLSIQQNSRYLITALERLDEISRLDWSDIKQDKGELWIIKHLTEDFGSYNNNIEYSYSKVMDTISAPDPRQNKDKEVGEALKSEEQEDISIEGAGIDINELPSRKKYNSENDLAFDGSLEDLSREIDLHNVKGRFADKAFKYIRDIGNSLAEDLKESRDDIYINEYIMDMFNSSVASLNNHSKKNHDRFFNSEIEYILHGHSSEKINKIKTQAQILLMRFGINTLHVYSDNNKRELAKGIGAAVAGWWTAGAGIPIISNLIICAWGMGEAILDLKDLKEGKTVPLYKLKGDWKLDIGLPLDKEPKSDSRLSFNYHDYMRLFLLLVNTEKKIDRIEDLMELNSRKINSSFRMGRCFTYIKIEADISMNYLFITQAFVPGNKKTEDGRHILRVVLYEGY